VRTPFTGLRSDVARSYLAYLSALHGMHAPRALQGDSFLNTAVAAGATGTGGNPSVAGDPSTLSTLTLSRYLAEGCCTAAVRRRGTTGNTTRPTTCAPAGPSEQVAGDRRDSNAHVLPQGRVHVQLREGGGFRVLKQDCQ
jgi:hypothetical protein